MTDTIEAAQLADMICGCANREQHRRDVKLIEDYVAARITAHTKALIEGAGDVEQNLNDEALSLQSRSWQRVDGGQEFSLAAMQLEEAAATIAALRAEVGRAKLDGVRAGIEASADFIQELGPSDDIGNWEAAGAIRALDAEAIAKGEGA